MAKCYNENCKQYDEGEKDSNCLKYTKWRVDLCADYGKKDAVAKLQLQRGVIKPCPFCGSTDIEGWNTVGKQPAQDHMWCKSCLTDGPREESTEEAIEAWNKRAL